MSSHEIEQKLRKLASVDSQKAELSWKFYLSGNAEERQEADELVDILLFQKLSKDYREKILLDPPSPAQCAGEFELGKVVYPAGEAFCSFGLREDEWIKHMLITGMTGAGKTNLAFQILRELKQHNKPFLIFDWKRNYR